MILLRFWRFLNRYKIARLANALALSHNAQYYDKVMPRLRHPVLTRNRYQCFWSGLWTDVPVGWLEPGEKICPGIEKRMLSAWEEVFDF